MFIRNPPIGPRVIVPKRRPCVHQALTLLLTTLVVLASACESNPAATEQWLPSYLEMNLYAGKAQLQWPGESQWTAMDGKANITIDEGGRISADPVEGAKFFLGDGSTLELAPETTIEVHNSRTLPRLQVIVEKGSILFFAQKPSYEFPTSICQVKLLNVPSIIRIKVDGETTQLAVEEGAVTCEMETETLTLLTCRQMQVRAGEEPTVNDFCTRSTVVPPPTATPSPSPTPLGFELTVTPTSSPSSTPTPTRGTAVPASTRGVIPTPTHTPPPPTTEPAAPKPKPTQPPPEPTKPPTEPPPEPTQPPAPEPTQPRATPKPPEPTEPPPEPTEPPPEPTEPPPEPTAEAPRPTQPPPEPTSEGPRPTAESG